MSETNTFINRLRKHEVYTKSPGGGFHRGRNYRSYKPSSVPFQVSIIKLSAQPANAAEAVDGASRASSPIWVCSERGLPCHTRRHRWALTPPFHPYRLTAAVCFCGTFHRSGLPRTRRSLQPAALLYGVRTFLPRTRTRPYSKMAPRAIDHSGKKRSFTTRYTKIRPQEGHFTSGAPGS